MLNRIARTLIFPAAMSLTLAGAAVTAERAQADPAFARWVEGMVWPAAKARGISRRTFWRAMKGVTPEPKVLEAADHQPEFVRPIWEYLDSACSAARIANGQAMLARYRSQFDAIERRYGVDRHILAAIWGVESSYGAFPGKHNVIRALATLAHGGEGRRQFGLDQLLAALEIIERGDIEPEHMVGSWAGAMGHTQFIPTTYNRYAVDFTGDGTRDIWRSVSDALASTANYLNASGWRHGETWGYEVTVPADFDYNLVDQSTAKPLAQWQVLGVRRARGGAFPRPDDRATLALPAGARGPGFLMIANFDVIKRYNNSTAYALAVGHLADRLRGSGAFAQPWPVDDKPLARGERLELQRRLSALGYATGDIDGVIGAQTRSALRAYQRANGLIPDGYPTVPLLLELRKQG